MEGPENCLKPKLIQASREGHCVIFYENGSFCTFSVNGKLQATMETDDNIRVSVPYRLLSVCFHLSVEVVRRWKGHQGSLWVPTPRASFSPERESPDSTRTGVSASQSPACPAVPTACPACSPGWEVKPGGAFSRGLFLDLKPSWVAVSGAAHFFFFLVLFFNLRMLTAQCCFLSIKAKIVPVGYPKTGSLYP